MGSGKTASSQYNVIKNFSLRGKGRAMKTNNSNKFRHTVRRLLRTAVRIGCAAIVISYSVILGALAAQHDPIGFNIAGKDLSTALKNFALEADVDILYDADLVKGKQAQRLKGEYTREEALEKLLEGTELKAEKSKEKVYLIFQASAAGVMGLQTGVQSDEVVASNGVDRKEGAGEKRMDEVVVIGSNIRGTKSASSVRVFDEVEIENSGFSTIHDFVRALPQNFNGGISEANGAGITTANNASDNYAAGTGVNLRGLGNDSTLVLVNGHRWAPASNGGFVDVSMIPLTAVKRIEVLLDGASATYGSDAIGGVVNFILYENLEGMSSQIRYGIDKDNKNEAQIGQTFGANWESGNLLLSYEYYQRESIESSDRSFTVDAEDPFDLLPEQERHSLLLSTTQNLTEHTKLFGSVFYSKRDFIARNTSSSNSFRRSGDSTQYSVTIGTVVDGIGESWKGEIAGSYSNNDTFSKSLNLNTMLPVGSGGSNYESASASFDAKIDGIVARISGGDVRVAFGSHYREEKYKNPISLMVYLIEVDEDRDVAAFFGEMFLPIISKENRIPGVERLELTVAVRNEDYSDFGTSTDPKIGLLWSPVNSINIRGTYGTSFRAPLLSELVENNTLAFLLDFIPHPDAPLDPPPLILWAFGNNSKLEPELATTTSVGIDFRPNLIPFSLSLTYFDIEYEDRVSEVNPGFDLFNPIYENVVHTNYDPALAVYLMSLPFSGDLTGGSDPTTAEYFVDSRLRNLASTNMNGFDMLMSYGFETGLGGWDITLSATYYSKNEERQFENSPTIDKLNTVSNPIDIKLYGGISWNNGPVGANISVNYINDYKDVRFTPSVDVDSWTTANFNITYSTEGSGEKIMDNMKMTINVQNVFDRDPPFVEGFFVGRGLNYDSDNSSPLGRYISLRLSKNW